MLAALLSAAVIALLWPAASAAAGTGTSGPWSAGEAASAAAREGRSPAQSASEVSADRRKKPAPLPAGRQGDRAKATKAGTGSDAPAALEPKATLGQLIVARAKLAAGARRNEDIEQLGTLWLNLHRRGELERTVERGDAFVSVSLRNQGISEHRRDVRRSRFVPVDPETMGSLPEARDGYHCGTPWVRADEALGAAQFVASLAEPYRTAVELALQGLNRREVAEQMGVNHATVRKWMQRLREQIEQGTLLGLAA